MKPLVCSALVVVSLLSVSCSLNQQETDGRKYYVSHSPAQSKMGVTYRRVPTTTPEGKIITKGTIEDTPAGLMDVNEKPDEPGAHYWLHGRHTANPVESKMGVRVRRIKREEPKPQQ